MKKRLFSNYLENTDVCLSVQAVFRRSCPKPSDQHLAFNYMKWRIPAFGYQTSCSILLIQATTYNEPFNMEHKMRGRLWFGFFWTLSWQQLLPVVFSVTDEANNLCVKQKATPNSLLKTTQPTTNTAAWEEYMKPCKAGKCPNYYLTCIRYSLYAHL